MKLKLFITLSLFITIILLGSQTNFISNLFKSPTAYAVGGLFIDWGVPHNKPIFTITNMAPGQSETHTVKVHNGTKKTLPVSIRGMKKTETGNLASVLDIKISTNNTDVYGGASRTGPKTLRQFLHQTSRSSSVLLSNLKPDHDASYVITVSFKKTAGNKFQAKKIIFDLNITPALTSDHDCKKDNGCKTEKSEKRNSQREKED